MKLTLSLILLPLALLLQTLSSVGCGPGGKSQSGSGESEEHIASENSSIKTKIDSVKEAALRTKGASLKAGEKKVKAEAELAEARTKNAPAETIQQLEEKIREAEAESKKLSADAEALDARLKEILKAQEMIKGDPKSQAKAEDELKKAEAKINEEYKKAVAEIEKKYGKIQSEIEKEHEERIRKIEEESKQRQAKIGQEHSEQIRKNKDEYEEKKKKLNAQSKPADDYKKEEARIDEEYRKAQAKIDAEYQEKIGKIEAEEKERERRQREADKKEAAEDKKQQEQKLALLDSAVEKLKSFISAHKPIPDSAIKNYNQQQSKDAQNNIHESYEAGRDLIEAVELKKIETGDFISAGKRTSVDDVIAQAKNITNNDLQTIGKISRHMEQLIVNEFNEKIGKINKEGEKERAKNLEEAKIDYDKAKNGFTKKLAEFRDGVKKAILFESELNIESIKDYSLDNFKLISKEITSHQLIAEPIGLRFGFSLLKSKLGYIEASEQKLGNKAFSQSQSKFISDTEAQMRESVEQAEAAAEKLSKKYHALFKLVLDKAFEK